MAAALKRVILLSGPPKCWGLRSAQLTLSTAPSEALFSVTMCFSASAAGSVMLLRGVPARLFSFVVSAFNTLGLVPAPHVMRLSFRGQRATVDRMIVNRPHFYTKTHP